MVQFQLEDQLPDWLRDAKSEEKVLNSKDEPSNDQCHVYRQGIIIRWISRKLNQGNRFLPG